MEPSAGNDRRPGGRSRAQRLRPGYHVKRAQHVLRQAMDRALGEVGMSMAQYALLSALEDQPDASNADLARACFVTPQTMIETLKDLEAGGLVTRRRRSQDRRVIATTLTSAGRTKLAAAHQLVDAVEGRMAAGMTPADRRRLSELLDRVVASLTGEPGGLSPWNPTRPWPEQRMARPTPAASGRPDQAPSGGQDGSGCDLG